NAPTSWAWDFENDGIVDSTAQNPVHTFTAGTYTVSLTVANADGSDTEVKTDYITVSSSKPQKLPKAMFIAFPRQGTAPLTVSFRDFSWGKPTSWAWDFESDGIVDSTDQNPVHTYPNPGRYNVTLTVKNVAGSDTTIRKNYITVVVPRPPHAEFAASPRIGMSPLTVSFRDLSSGKPASWAWDFENDGIVDSTDQNPVHTYLSSGRYNVSLTVKNTAGSDTTVRKNFIIVIAQRPPRAGFAASPKSGMAPLAVSFVDLSTGKPTSWAWDFDNDGIVDSTDQNPVHTYAAAGVYTVNLTVANAAGSNSRVMKDYITVKGEKPPEAMFSAWPQQGTAPLTVAFRDLSRGNPVTRAWDFGDGSTSTDPNPTHTYLTPGKYTVTLTVTNGAGSDTAVMKNLVTVDTKKQPGTGTGSGNQGDKGAGQGGKPGNSGDRPKIKLS
ncbi:MAG TPA: PKD domain-containing protein, partial [Methanomicrobiales archaeon]|nr:PKD domain-containing protein [Methanomicrobiales archaeon]